LKERNCKLSPWNKLDTFEADYENSLFTLHSLKNNCESTSVLKQTKKQNYLKIKTMMRSTQWGNEQMKVWKQRKLQITIWKKKKKIRASIKSKNCNETTMEEENPEWKQQKLEKIMGKRTEEIKTRTKSKLWWYQNYGDQNNEEMNWVGENNKNWKQQKLKSRLKNGHDKKSQHEWKLRSS
jgi:hypothetical protein